MGGGVLVGVGSAPAVAGPTAGTATDTVGVTADPIVGSAAIPVRAGIGVNAGDTTDAVAEAVRTGVALSLDGVWPDVTMTSVAVAGTACPCTPSSVSLVPVPSTRPTSVVATVRVGDPALGALVGSMTGADDASAVGSAICI